MTQLDNSSTDTDLNTFPEESPTMKTVACQVDANPTGDIFGGWLLGQMDLAGALRAYQEVGKRIVTVGVDAMTFKKPVYVGDEVLFFTSVEKTGTTSITIKIDSWAKRADTKKLVKVTEGSYTFVAIDENRKPVPIHDKSDK